MEGGRSVIFGVGAPQGMVLTVIEDEVAVVLHGKTEGTVVRMSFVALGGPLDFVVCVQDLNLSVLLEDELVHTVR